MTDPRSSTETTRNYRIENRNLLRKGKKLKVETRDKYYAARTCMERDDIVAYSVLDWHAKPIEEEKSNIRISSESTIQHT